MKNEEIVVEELNTLLRGTYMGVHSLEHYIQKVDDAELKKKFQSMQQEVKQNAQKVAERIQNLEGVPADNEGVSGRMHTFMHNKMVPDNTREMIEEALKGTDNYGVHYAEEVVKGDLDPKSKRMVEEVIDTNRKHAEELRQLLH
ncbi:bacterioferritin [Geomicrobium halophilum]|uniref:Bacterioferritin n=1 Tax=Geomicrobium halophilum TaxID=549000 RepID=A0A841PHH7_9BACL|nr:DUF2383 domain-containing protein [Geomicrobium halophilum]MBB6448199.1 bacterioferritin [Geomicrobium halophilum]